LVSTVLATPSVQPTRDASPAAQDPVQELFFHFSKYLDIFRLPFKAVSTLFTWGEVVPLKLAEAAYIAGQRQQIKTISSTFALPKFFIKQFHLYTAWNNLTATITKPEIDVAKLVGNIKQVFFKTMSSIISALKIPQLFDRTGVIDLTKISRLLPNALAKTENVFSLVVYSMKLVDSTWKLRSVLKKNLAANGGQWEGFSARAIGSMIKVGSNGIKMLSASVTTAALFFGVYVAPLAAVLLTTLSFTVSLTSKVVRHNDLLQSGCSRKAFHPDLPA
jgi:hypothetical protein